MKILFYSKFVFDTPSNRPSQRPQQTVGGRMVTQSQKSRQHVERKRKAVESLKKKKEGLFKFWKNNNPKGKIEVTEDDPKAVVFHEIRDPLRAKEVYLLMSLIEKFWDDMGGASLAMRLYREAKTGRKKAYDLDFKPFEHFFRKGNHSGSATERLGFYFWKKKNEWYTYDADKNSDDESGGSTYLVKCITHIRTEFGNIKNKDSGLSVEEEKDRLDFLKNNMKEAKGYYNEKYREKGRKFIKWFQSKAIGKWVALDSKTARMMNVLFGAGVGKYLYRYSSDQKRIYFLKLQGASLAANEGESGYIDVEDGKLGKWKWHNDMNELKKGLLDEMKPEDVSQELLKEKTKAGEEIKEDQAVDATKRTLIRIHKIKRVKYSKLTAEYVEPLEKALKVELKKQGYSDSKAESVAQASIASLKRKIEKKINDDPELKKAKEKDPALEISLDKEGEPKVNFRDTGARVKIRKVLEKAKEAAKGVDLDKLIEQKTSAITKALGPLGMFLKMFGVDLKKHVTEYYKTGKKSIVLMIVGGMGATVELGRRVLRGVGIKSKKDLEKFAKKNGGVLEKDQKIKKKLKLKGYKITIPKGKGIKPGEEFFANKKKISPQVEKKEKPKFSFLGLFASKKSGSKFVMQDQEIIIAKNDTIPKGTVIPKGAKIEKA